MAITFISNALGTTSTTTTFSITLPATAAGDILILEFCHRGTGNGTIAGTYTGPAFTLKHSQLFATSAFSGKTYWSRATGNHTGQTVTGSGLTDSCAAILTIYRGALASGDPLADATIVGEQNASGDETQAGITTTTAGAWVVFLVANSPDTAVTAQACTSPGTLTARAERLSTGGTDTAIAHASAEKATAGATGNFTWSELNNATGSWAYAITPAPVTVITETEGASTGTATVAGIGQTITMPLGGYVHVGYFHDDYIAVGYFAEPSAAVAGEADGNASGTATVTGAAAAINARAVTAAGTCTVTGPMSAAFPAEGTASGSATVSGDGIYLGALSGYFHTHYFHARYFHANYFATLGAPAGDTEGDVFGIATVIGLGAMVKLAVAAASGSATCTALASIITARTSASAGAATITGLAAIVTAATTSAIGTGTATGLASAVALVTGASSGSSPVSGVGDFLTAGGATGTSAGFATVAGIGATVFATEATSSLPGGLPPPVGVGAAAALTTGSSLGTATVAGLSTRVVPGGAASVGTATVAGIGASIGTTVGSSAGSATVSADATNAAATGSDGASVGGATVSGVGAALVASLAASPGGATVSGISGLSAAVIASSAGAATVSGAAAWRTPTQAASPGVATVSGVGAARALTTGASIGSATISGSGQAVSSVGSEFHSVGSATVAAQSELRTGPLVAFQPGPGPSMLRDFEQGAFQLDAFQISQTVVIFQTDAFQLGAFQGAPGALTTTDTTGTATGSATVAGIGKRIASVTASSAGGATITGRGALRALTTGSTAGFATVTGFVAEQTETNAAFQPDAFQNNAFQILPSNLAFQRGAFQEDAFQFGLASADGNSAGIATVTGIASALWIRVINSQGTSTVTGLSAPKVGRVGTSSGFATVSGVGEAAGSPVLDQDYFHLHYFHGLYFNPRYFGKASGALTLAPASVVLTLATPAPVVPRTPRTPSPVVLSLVVPVPIAGSDDVPTLEQNYFHEHYLHGRYFNNRYFATVSGAVFTVSPSPVPLSLVIPSPILALPPAGMKSLMAFWVGGGSPPGQPTTVALVNPVALTMTTPAVVVTRLRRVTPDPIPVPLVIPVQAVHYGDNQTVTPAPTVVTFTVGTPSLAQRVYPTPIVVSLQIQDSSLTVGGVIRTPAVVPISLGVPPVTLVPGLATRSPAPVVLTLFMEPISVVGSRTVAPTPVPITLTVPVPVAGVTQFIRPTPVPLTLVLPDLVAPQTLTPSVVTVTVEVISPTLTSTSMQTFVTFQAPSRTKKAAAGRARTFAAGRRTIAPRE